MDYNYIFFDCESNSGRSHADILTISALFVIALHVLENLEFTK